jgi:mono/diheme cytochrome c family protein
MRNARATICIAGLAAAAAIAAGMVGCALQVENLRPAEELAAQHNKPPGSVYLGWRVYAEKCATCHGAAAGGTAQAPDLTTRMSDMSPRRFAHLVLVRYDLDDPASPARARGSDTAARDARIDDILQRRERPQQMPAWQGEPRVNAHILDLYAYLAARAEGRQGPGRPAP